MLLWYLLLVVLQCVSHQSAADFLANCPLQGHEQVSDGLVIDTLKTFYDDLSFVKAITESGQDRGYGELIEEIRNVIKSDDAREQIERGINELSSGNWRGFTRVFSYNWEVISRDKQGQSYYYYLTSELNRLRGSTSTYLLKNAIRTRQKNPGVSLNELARLDGLIVLQIVSQFNREIDWLYGIRQSPNFDLLSSIHTVLRDESTPLNDIRYEILDRLFRTAPMIGINGINSSSVVLDSMQRTDPYIDNFRHQGPTISNASVQSILCELAQKLSILGVASPDEHPSFSPEFDYQPVIEQASELEADFAEQLRANVVNIIDPDPVEALDNATGMRKALDGFGNSKSKQSFLKYFEVELRLRSTKRCNMDTLSAIETGLVFLENARRTSRGVSLGDIVELKGKAVYLQLTCFHERLKWAYDLDGYEATEQQLEAKRAKYGSCERILPASDSIYLT